jgi:MarR family transcriptional regulator, transcriptional regulator for hemolysin
MDEEDILFAVLVSDVARMLRTELNRRVRDHGLTRSQWMALSKLARLPGVSLSELSDMLEMEKAPAGRLIDRLEDGGWVRREPDAQDRRVKRLYPTAAAEAVYKKMRRITVQTMDDVFDGLEPGAREQACALLATIKSQLVGMNGNGSLANGHDRTMERIGTHLK